MRRYLLILTVAYSLHGKLVPTPLITDPEPVQRFTERYACQELHTPLFGEVWGISFVKLRNVTPEKWLGVISDICGRLMLILGVDDQGNRYCESMKGFDDWAHPQYFSRPHGLACDSTVFNGNPNHYFVYTADFNRNCIVRTYYDADKEERCHANLWH